MSARKTKKFTKKLEDAYVDPTNARKGREGELAVIELLRSYGFEVIDKESNQRLQSLGVDIVVEKDDKLRYVDVKTNLTDAGDFYVYSDWNSWKGKCDIIIHVNLTHNLFLWYNIADMRKIHNFNVKFIKYDWFNPPNFVSKRAPDD